MKLTSVQFNMIYHSGLLVVLCISLISSLRTTKLDQIFVPEYLNCEFTTISQFCGYQFGANEWFIDPVNSGTYPSIMTYANHLISAPVTIKHPTCLQIVYRLRASADHQSTLTVWSENSEKNITVIYSDNTQRNFDKAVAQIQLDILNEPITYSIQLSHGLDNFGSRRLESIRVRNGICPGGLISRSTESPQLDYKLIKAHATWWTISHSNHVLACTTSGQFRWSFCTYEVNGFNSNVTAISTNIFNQLKQEKGTLKSYFVSKQQDPFCFSITYYAQGQSLAQARPVIAIKTLPYKSDNETIERSTNVKTGDKVMRVIQFTIEPKATRYQVIVEMNMDSNDKKFEDVIGFGRIEVSDGKCEDLDERVGGDKSATSSDAGISASSIIMIIVAILIIVAGIGYFSFRRSYLRKK